MSALSEEENKVFFSTVYSVVDKLNQEYKDKYEHKDGLPEGIKRSMIKEGIKIVSGYQENHINRDISEDDLKQRDDFKQYFPLKCTLPQNLKSQFKNRITQDDGNCLFHAIAYWVNFYNGSNIDHMQVRKDICDFLCNQHDYKILSEQGVQVNQPYNYEGTPYDNYICNMRNPGVWGGEPEIEAAAMHYNMNIKLYKIDGIEAMNINQALPNKAYLYNCSQLLDYGTHYEVLIPTEQQGFHLMGGSIKNLAKLYNSSQNLVYGLKNLAKLI